MKINVRGKPVFAVNFSLALLDALHTCSKSHYDGACRQLSQEAVGGFENGIITQMISMADFMKADGEEREVTWRELDLLTKVCEMHESDPRLTVIQHALLTDFQKTAHAAFNVANANSVYWRVPVEV